VQVAQNRCLYENIVPDTAFPGVTPPPSTVLSCFTPCGTYLIAFQPISNEVVAYRFRGLYVSSNLRNGVSEQAHGMAGRAGPAEDAAAANGAADTSRPAPHVQPRDMRQQASGSAAEQPRSGQAAQQSGGQAEQTRQQAAFADVFEEHWRCCPCPGRQEQISIDFCLGERWAAAVVMPHWYWTPVGKHLPATTCIG
jgi:hypothetical protein